jgi:hypothetical protein
MVTSEVGHPCSEIAVPADSLGATAWNAVCSLEAGRSHVGRAASGKPPGPGISMTNHTLVYQSAIRRFLQAQSLAGVVLMAAAVVAFLIANSPRDLILSHTDLQHVDSMAFSAAEMANLTKKNEAVVRRVLAAPSYQSGRWSARTSTTCFSPIRSRRNPASYLATATFRAAAGDLQPRSRDHACTRAQYQSRHHLVDASRRLRAGQGCGDLPIQNADGPDRAERQMDAQRPAVRDRSNFGRRTHSGPSGGEVALSGPSGHARCAGSTEAASRRPGASALAPVPTAGLASPASASRCRRRPAQTVGQSPSSLPPAHRPLAAAQARGMNHDRHASAERRKPGRAAACRDRDDATAEIGFEEIAYSRPECFMQIVPALAGG